MNEWRPNSDAKLAKRRADMLARVRRYFEARSVLEVDTPSLSHTTVTDPNIASIGVSGDRFLSTSPEFAMKRLLAAGYPDIFSICRVFRDEERGRLHLPEFTMVEWYRHGFGLDDIVRDTLALIAFVASRPELAHDVPVIDYADVIQQFAGVDPLTASVDELAHAAEADAELAASLGDRRDDWLDLLLATRVAPSLPSDSLTVIRHYPISQAALARCNPDNPAVADRFEVFIGNVELANGFVELTDAEEQAERMQTDIDERRRRGQPTPDPDEHFLDALRAGLPECAGVALGFERLHMFVEECDDIRDVVTFS
ncbi:MAG: EF-P lysine aminoacylase EpmA [Woeseiaceae bacterium]|nr:EF-P lysine aminoacylase EpmA [Woeseiaceae bacterium]